MRTLSLIVITCLLMSCLANKKTGYEYVAHIDSQAAGEKFMDSLRKQNIDTIVGYFYWSQIGDAPFYIYWQNDGRTFLSKVNRIATYKTIDGRSLPDELFDTAMLRKLTGDTAMPRKVVAPDGKTQLVWTTCDDCSSEQIYMYLRNSSYRFSVNDQGGTWTPTRLFADKFRSILFHVENRWQGENYKKEKIKMRNGYQIWD